VPAAARWQRWSAPEPVGVVAHRRPAAEQVIEADGEVLPEHVAGHPLIPPSRLRKNPQTSWRRRGTRPVLVAAANPYRVYTGRNRKTQKELKSWRTVDTATDSG
jgi:hypothetical protein